MLMWLQVDLLMSCSDQMLLDALTLRDRILNGILKPTFGASDIGSGLLGTTSVATVASVAAATAAAAAAATSSDAGGWQQGSFGQDGAVSSGEGPSMSVLVAVPCLEVLCFTDVSMEPSTADGSAYK